MIEKECDETSCRNIVYSADTDGRDIRQKFQETATSMAVHYPASVCNIVGPA